MSRVSDSVEWPNVFFGSFDETFFDLPEFLLKTILSEKQDNFTFKKENGKLSYFFGFVSNLELNKKEKLIFGNQNVLKARFKDAQFFIEEDSKTKLSDKAKKLSSIIFYNDLGTLMDRSERIQKLCLRISEIIDLDISNKIDKLKFSNVDLTTELVREYPSLQGYVGGFYAKLNGFDEEVCDAFSSQYEFSSNTIKNELAFVLSVSQKIDSVFGFFASNRKVTGSGDPFGIRRIVLSLINLLIHKEVNLGFSDIFKVLIEIYENQRIQIKFDKSKVIEFLNKRIEILLSERGYDVNLIKSCFLKDDFNPSIIFSNIKRINFFLNSKEGKEFIKSYKRLESIIWQEKIEKKIDEKIFKKIEEKRLFLSTVDLKKDYEKNTELLNKKSFYDLSKNINEFLDNVMVNSQIQKLKIIEFHY